MLDQPRASDPRTWCDVIASPNTRGWKGALLTLNFAWIEELLRCCSAPVASAQCSQVSFYSLLSQRYPDASTVDFAVLVSSIVDRTCGFSVLGALQGYLLSRPH